MREPSNPDTFVVWNRAEEPGELPRWESQCGIVEQVRFGNEPCYKGYVLEDRSQYIERTTLLGTQKAVEKASQKSHPLVWAYEDEDERLAAKPI